MRLSGTTPSDEADGTGTAAVPAPPQTLPTTLLTDSVRLRYEVRHKETMRPPAFKVERKSGAKAADSTLKLIAGDEYDICVVIDDEKREMLAEPLPRVCMQIITDGLQPQPSIVEVDGAALLADEDDGFSRLVIGAVWRAVSDNGSGKGGRSVVVLTVEYQSARGIGCVSCGLQAKLYEPAKNKDAAGGQSLGYVLMHGEPPPYETPEGVERPLGGHDPARAVLMPSFDF